jgi:hypothetical protein
MNYLDLNSKLHGFRMPFRSQLIPSNNLRDHLNEHDFVPYVKLSSFLHGLSLGRAYEKAHQIGLNLNYLPEYPQGGHPLDVNSDGRVDFRDGYIIEKQLQRQTSYINL